MTRLDLIATEGDDWGMNTKASEWVPCWGTRYTWTTVGIMPRTGIGTCAFSGCTDREPTPIIFASTLREIERENCEQYAGGRPVIVTGFSLIWCDEAPTKAE